MANNRKFNEQDQFLSTTTHGLSWASRNRSTAIGAGIALVVIVLALVGGYSFYQHRVTEAQTAFGAAMQTYQTPIASPTQPAPPGTKTFADQKTRATEANKQFLDVASQYGMTEPGKMAKYFAGLTYIDMGQNGSAEDTLKSVAKSWNGDDAALAKLALALLYQQTGRNSQAADLYNELAKTNAATVPSGEAKLQLAEMYEAAGNKADANKIYAELKDKDKDAKGEPGPAGAIAASKLGEKK